MTATVAQSAPLARVMLPKAISAYSTLPSSIGSA